MGFEGDILTWVPGKGQELEALGPSNPQTLRPGSLLLHDLEKKMWGHQTGNLSHQTATIYHTFSEQSEFGLFGRFQASDGPRIGPQSWRTVDSQKFSSSSALPDTSETLRPLKPLFRCVPSKWLLQLDT